MKIISYEKGKEKGRKRKNEKKTTTNNLPS